ncbi:MAG: ferrous iron transport protein B, partial [Cytophagales bacterium]
MNDDSLNIVLVGNPNAGKTTLFNSLTGLRQKTGNFPGVTVDRFEGLLLIEGKKFQLSDLPGTYSLYPKSEDEKVVLNSLLGKYKEFLPDRLLLVLDASTLKRSLLLFSQVADLGIPMMVAVTMEDVALEKNESIDVLFLEKHFKIPFVSVNPRTGLGIDKINKIIFNDGFKVATSGFSLDTIVTHDFIYELKSELNTSNDYVALLEAHLESESTLNSSIKQINSKHKFISRNCQARETLQRYFLINQLVDKAVLTSEKKSKKTFTEKLDKVLTHKLYGYLVFLAILFIVFQSIFALAAYPMHWIEQAISFAQHQLHPMLGGGIFADLISEGVLSGIGGVLMFVPQITFLFFFVSLLEETGYMARVMFIMDKLMRVFGMSGKSVIPLVSGVACAVPAIMSTRTIDNKKERLITIFVTPFISCSARIPVFTIMIGLLVQPKSVLGIFNLQGFVLMACYLVGFCAALFTA